MKWYELANEMDTLRSIGGRYLGILEVWGKIPRLRTQHPISSPPRRMALCPFHNEKTPSLRVWGSQRFKCHGCGKEGDVFTLLEEFEGCRTTWDSLRTLPLEYQKAEIVQFKKVLESYLDGRLPSS
jgi:hypothetical protein